MRTGRDTSDACAQGKEHMRTQKEGSRLQGEASGETNPAFTLIMDFQTPELC